MIESTLPKIYLTRIQIIKYYKILGMLQVRQRRLRRRSCRNDCRAGVARVSCVAISFEDRGALIYVLWGVRTQRRDQVLFWV